MDPAASLKHALGALRDGDIADAEDYLKAYADWRINDGFEPVWTDRHGNNYLDGDHLAEVLNDALTLLCAMKEAA
jgi:hypothetical protein